MWLDMVHQFTLTLRFLHSLWFSTDDKLTANCIDRVCVCVVTLDCVVFTSLELCDNERIRCWHLKYFLASRLCFQSKYSIPLQADSVVRKRLEVEALSLSINTATLLSSRDPMSRTQHVKSKRTQAHGATWPFLLQASWPASVWSAPLSLPPEAAYFF